MAATGVRKLVYDDVSQRQWDYMLRLLRLRRLMRLCVRSCTTHCSFWRHIAKNVFGNGTPRFSHQPYGLPLRFSYCQTSLRVVYDRKPASPWGRVHFTSGGVPGHRFSPKACTKRVFPSRPCITLFRRMTWPQPRQWCDPRVQRRAGEGSQENRRGQQGIRCMWHN